jgi:hypothetical protein
LAAVNVSEHHTGSEPFQVSAGSMLAMGYAVDEKALALFDGSGYGNALVLFRALIVPYATFL